MNVFRHGIAKGWLLIIKDIWIAPQLPCTRCTLLTIFFLCTKANDITSNFLLFFYVQKQMTLQKQEEELQKEKNLKQE